jgi:hypothetical protein
VANTTVSAFSGLVDRDRRGVWVYYRARTEALGTLIGDPRQ